MSKISAKIIADSISAITQDRITSFVIVIPRIVLAEFNTHRMISRNSASSRAIPFEKMLEKVQNEPFIPIKWQKDHSGMQGNEYWDEKEFFEGMKHIPAVEMHKIAWLRARDNAIREAELLSGTNVTNQLCNRLLEPFMYHTIICTATEWENFFALRHHPAAEIHIAKVAELMLEAMNESTPKVLQAGEWHIPFGDKIDRVRLESLVDRSKLPSGKAKKISEHTRELVEVNNEMDILKIKIATARCARVSYMNYEGGDDYEKDIQLHDRLAEMGHWSPAEHCARTMNFAECGWTPEGEATPWSGNFRGFIQYRKTFENENKSDNRLIKKSNEK